MQLWKKVSYYIAKGYQPVETGDTVATVNLFVASDEHEVAVQEQLFGGRQRRILMVLPTYFSRATQEQHLELVESVCRQIQEAQDWRPDTQIVLALGMQYEKEEKLHARALLRYCLDYTEKRSTVSIGILLPKSRKAATLNAAIQLANANDVDGVAWMDDDVTLEKNCIGFLVARFIEKNCRGAVGATKIGRPKLNLASRLLFLAKQATMPACNYPHGCCILVERRMIASGIPKRYVSDDGYVCFELLDPTKANPLHSLELVEGALCHHFVGGTAVQAIRRIRRMLTNHHIFLADYPPATSKYYFTHILFYGLWPIAPWCRELPFFQGAVKWFLKALYLMWFISIGLSLFVRGLLNRPLREIKWGGLPDAHAPELPL